MLDKVCCRNRVCCIHRHAVFAAPKDGSERSPIKRLASSRLWLWCRALCCLLANHTAVSLALSLCEGSDCPCFTHRPVVCPFAALAAVLAFSAFFTLCAAARFSLPSLIAAERLAARASGRCERRSLITSREAPTTARWDLTWRRRRVLACS